MGRRRAEIPRTASAALRALLVAAVIAALTSATAAAAKLERVARHETRTALAKRGLEPVKVSCRLVKHGHRRAHCRWVAAKRRGSRTLACRGSGDLASKRGSLRFRRGSCRKDRGGTRLSRTAPDRLAKKGLEAIDVFCWGLLGRGFKCRFEAIRFADRTFDCTGVATLKRRRFRVRRRRCRVDAPATAAQTTVATELRALALRERSIRCREGDGAWRCRWRATREDAGWTYHCSGTATAAAPDGPFELGRCRLRAPRLSPLRAADPNLAFGVNDNWGHLLAQIPRAAAIGSDTLRLTLPWAGVERTRGSYDFSHFDRVYARMLAAGVRPLFVLMGAPCWATGDGACSAGEMTRPPAPAYESAWRAFVARVAQRYPRARGIEVWNEPNYSRFFAGGPDPERYARLLTLAHRAVRSVGSNTPVITGGLAAFTKSGRGRMRYDRFLAKAFAAGAAGSADGIGHHAYSGRRLRDGYAEGLRIQLADLEDVALRFGRQHLPVWITETGVSSAARGVSEREQARADVKAYRTLRRTPGVAAVIVHRWRDGRGSGAESGYGLTTRHGGTKRALCALAAARGRSCPK